MGKVIDKSEFWYIKDNPITKTGVFPYLGAQIGQPDLEPNKIYYVLRPAEELFKPETVESFNGLPITIEHAMLGSEAQGLTKPEDKGIDGVTLESAHSQGDKLLNNIRLFSEQIKDAVNSGKKELSAGYYCDFVPESGTYNGQHYDFVQRNIFGNHIALVDKGRSGSEIRVMDSAIKSRMVFDSMDLGTFTQDWQESEHPREKNGQFTEKGGGSASSGKSEQVKTETPKNAETKTAENAEENTPERQKVLTERLDRLSKAVETLKTGDEVEVKDLRDDLEQYGGSNDITIKYGQNNEKNKGFGIAHIAGKHGAEVVGPVLKAVVYGKVRRFVNSVKTIFLDYEGYEAMLALTESGKKKTWLLTGYDIREDMDKKKTQVEDSKSSLPTLSPTQPMPMCARHQLVACVINSLANNLEKINSEVKPMEDLKKNNGASGQENKHSMDNGKFYYNHNITQEQSLLYGYKKSPALIIRGIFMNLNFITTY